MLPQLSIPPPPASANGQALPHGSPERTVALGATRLRVMTLSRIVTVAPSEKRMAWWHLDPAAQRQHAGLSDDGL